jgi:hypothetical protein
MTVRSRGIKRPYADIQPGALATAAAAPAADQTPFADASPLTIARPLRLTRSPATPPEALGSFSRQQVRDGLVSNFDDVHRRARDHDASQLERHVAQVGDRGDMTAQHRDASIASQMVAQNCRFDLLVERQGLCDAWVEEDMAGPVPRYDPMIQRITDLAIRFGRMDNRVEHLNGRASVGD